MSSITQFWSIFGSKSIIRVPFYKEHREGFRVSLKTLWKCPFLALSLLTNFQPKVSNFDKLSEQIFGIQTAALISNPIEKHHLEIHSTFCDYDYRGLENFNSIVPSDWRCHFISDLSWNFLQSLYWMTIYSFSYLKNITLCSTITTFIIGFIEMILSLSK